MFQVLYNILPDSIFIFLSDVVWSSAGVLPNCSTHFVGSSFAQSLNQVIECLGIVLLLQLLFGNVYQIIRYVISEHISLRWIRCQLLKWIMILQFGFSLLPFKLAISVVNNILDLHSRTVSWAPSLHRQRFLLEQAQIFFTLIGLILCLLNSFDN